MQYLVLRQLAKDVNVRLSEPLDLDAARPFQALSVANHLGVAAVTTRDGASTTQLTQDSTYMLSQRFERRS